VKLPPSEPLEENYLCKGKAELAELLSRTLSQGSGAFFKVLGKMDGKPYYVTFLVDNRKILAVEAEDVRNSSHLMGEPAYEVLTALLEGSVIVDAFPLGDVDVKMSVIDNIDVYNATPKVYLSEICPGVKTPAPTDEATPEPPKFSQIAPPVKSSRHKKPKMELSLRVPPAYESYFRVFANRLKLHAKSLGLDLKKLGVEAKEVRYALGAGSGIHTVIEIEAESGAPVPLSRLKETLSSRAYKEAADLSKEIEKKVVISDVKLRIV